MKKLEVLSVDNVPIFRKESEFWEFLSETIDSVLQAGDILVIAHTPLSRIMNCIVNLEEVNPSEKAISLAETLNKDPKKIQVILDQSREIIKSERGILITENKSGTICANAGIDESNAGKGNVVFVPENPDLVANQIYDWVKSNFNLDIPVIISDSVGRALRRHAVNIAIGVYGLNPVKNYVGTNDLFGYELKISQIAVADEIASAAQLMMGEADEGTPIIIVRGFDYEQSFVSSASDLNRPKIERLFT